MKGRPVDPVWKLMLLWNSRLCSDDVVTWSPAESVYKRHHQYCLSAGLVPAAQASQSAAVTFFFFWRVSCGLIVTVCSKRAFHILIVWYIVSPHAANVSFVLLVKEIRTWIAVFCFFSPWIGEYRLHKHSKLTVSNEKCSARFKLLRCKTSEVQKVFLLQSPWSQPHEKLKNRTRVHVLGFYKYIQLGPTFDYRRMNAIRKNTETRRSKYTEENLVSTD